VVLDTPVAREAYGDAAIYVAAPDPDEVGAALVRVLTDEAWRRERSAAGLRQAARYSWDRAARETLDALVEAAG
jgi:alpha-1,3-rhamnosyl/mannosyltransferase